MPADEGTRELSAFHAAFADELKALLDHVPFATGMRVLDAACGDGFYVSALEHRVGPRGMVVGLDKSESILRHVAQPSKQKLVAGSIGHPALVSGSFDAVLCCQSLFSLPEPVHTLEQLAEFVRPDGLVVVVENDSLHQLMLPWPPGLELALRTAEYESFNERSQHPQKFYVGRHLPECFRAAGLEPRGFLTETFDRVAPLEPSAEDFLRLHLHRLQARVSKHLDAQANQELQSLLRSDNGQTWFREPTFTLTWQSVVAWATRPQP